MTLENLTELRIDLSVKSKNGIDFTLAAGIVWILISWIWTLNFKSYDKSVFTFIIGALMMPLAFFLSKLFKTTWTNRENPLQALGLWLNFSQLFYFPADKIPGLFCYGICDYNRCSLLSLCVVL